MFYLCFKSLLWTSAFISSILRMRGFEISSQPKNNYKFEHNWKQPVNNMQYTMWAMKPKQAFNLRASFDTIKIYVDTKQWVNQQMYVYNGPCHIWFMKDTGSTPEKGKQKVCIDCIRVAFFKKYIFTFPFCFSLLCIGSFHMFPRRKYCVCLYDIYRSPFINLSHYEDLVKLKKCNAIISNNSCK